jgi:hypothetical protein
VFNTVIDYGFDLHGRGESQKLYFNFELAVSV